MNVFNFKIARHSRSEQGECAVVRKMTGRRTLCVAGYATTAQYAAIGIVLIGLSLVTEGLPIERSDWLYSLVWLAFLSAVLGLVQAVLFATPTALIGEALARRLPSGRILWHLAPVPILPLIPAAVAYSFDGAAWQWWACLTLLGCVPALAAGRVRVPAALFAS
ncbi:hypothetical protein [Streptomyces sp. NBC_01443]|uniref:hypothetical protein n=1 Tax=Streptomyces sp. NBC_01443 TaxID=2903868 RepID=UPI002252F684|nr:hypothetical protein [Streptomyces sp. NBC_01443]MCX4632568.1 hypothetical protein [Streptomyces sp. NBC_01443]